MSEGFLDAKKLALKFSTLYALNKDGRGASHSEPCRRSERDSMYLFAPAGMPQKVVPAHQVMYVYFKVHVLHMYM